MKVILIMVLSADGKSTKGNKGPKHWASREDQQHFFKTLGKSKLIVMGGNSYRESQSVIRPDPAQLRIVITRNPQKYEKYMIRGQLEFRDDSPLELVKNLERQEYGEMLLVSGENLNSEFIKSNLITDIWLTIEPKIFGNGKNLIADEDLDLSLKLISIKKLNKQGTLLLKYKVVN